MPQTNNVKHTIGKETTAGKAVTTTAVIPVSAVGSLDRNVEKAQDPAIVGAGMPIGEYAVQASTGGSLPITPRACAGFGQILKGTFGDENTPAIVAGVIRVRHVGSGASSCKVALNSSAKTITFSTGAYGTETGDASIGTAGVVDLTAAGNDTIGELVTLINSEDDYECEKITGADATTIANVMVFSGTAQNLQAHGKWAIIVLVGTATGAYAHQFKPNLVSGEERPTFTIQSDGFQDALVRDGMAVKKLSLSAALKGFMSGDVEFIGMGEVGSGTPSVLTLEDAKPFMFAEGITSINGTDYNYNRESSVEFNVNAREDGYGQSSLDRAFHQKGMFGVSGSTTVRLDATSYADRAKVVSGAACPVMLVYKGKAIGSSIYELLIIEVPYALLSKWSWVESGQNLDCKYDWTGFNPGTNYDGPCTVTMISDDSTAY